MISMILQIIALLISTGIIIFAYLGFLKTRPPKIKVYFPDYNDLKRDDLTNIEIDSNVDKMRIFFKNIGKRLISKGDFGIYGHHIPDTH